MKKLYASFLAIIMFLSVPAVSYASSSQQPLAHTTIEDLGNGFYGITALEIQTSNTRATRTVSKTYTIKTASGSTAASFTLTATFRYPSGNSALCTYVSHDSSISDSQWSFSENVLRNLEILHKGILLQNKNILALQPKPSQKALP